MPPAWEEMGAMLHGKPTGPPQILAPGVPGQPGIPALLTAETHFPRVL